jgi:hypothetical protein
VDGSDYTISGPAADTVSAMFCDSEFQASQPLLNLREKAFHVVFGKGAHAVGLHAAH